MTRIIVMSILLFVFQFMQFNKNASGEHEFSFPKPALQLAMFQNNGTYAQKNVKRRLSDSGPESSPLFEGLGTHYSFIWVGTPPQRVSVIVDTGSHHTAFPCVGCKCGKHMDPFFDPTKSKSATVKNCGVNGAKCFFRQAYSEGSSWNAFKVKDKVWMGGPGIQDISSASNWSVNFEFGCQESETGLFRTQNVDGIMGMSAAEDTLPYQLVTHKLTTSRVFAMCFKPQGGVLTLGGVDISLHGKTLDGVRVDVELQFAKLLKPKGWFTVRVLDVALRRPGDSAAKTIGGPIFKMNGGKGTIVDSGTTDTYLPSALAGNFKSLFAAITGFQHSNNVVQLTSVQFSKLPTLVYSLEGLAADSRIEVEVRPESYMEHVKGDRYACRVYLSEQSGAVLGANFMNHHNVIFDIDNLRIGFAPSDCQYKAVPRDIPTLVETRSFSPARGKIDTPTRTNSNQLINYVDSLLPV